MNIIPTRVMETRRSSRKLVKRILFYRMIINANNTIHLALLDQADFTLVREDLAGAKASEGSIFLASLGSIRRRMGRPLNLILEIYSENSLAAEAEDRERAQILQLMYNSLSKSLYSV